MRFPCLWISLLLLLAPTVLPAQTAPADTDPLAFVTKGRAQNAKGNFNSALDSFNHALEINPQDSAALEGRGETHLGQGDLTDAISDFSRALQIEPDDEAALLHRGLAQSRQGNFTAAITDFNHALGLNDLGPGDAPNLLFERGRAKYLQGDDKGALADLDQAVTLKPDLADGYLFRGLAEDDEGKFDTAAADFTKDAQNGRPLAALWYWDAEMEGHHDDGANGTMPLLLARALARHPDPWISELGNLLLQKTTETQVQSDAQSGQAGGNRPLEAWFFIGLAREYSGDAAGARQAFGQVLTLDDSSSDFTIEARRHLKKLSP